MNYKEGFFRLLSIVFFVMLYLFAVVVTKSFVGGFLLIVLGFALAYVTIFSLLAIYLIFTWVWEGFTT